MASFGNIYRALGKAKQSVQDSLRDTFGVGVPGGGSIGNAFNKNVIQHFATVGRGAIAAAHQPANADKLINRAVFPVATGVASLTRPVLKAVAPQAEKRLGANIAEAKFQNNAAYTLGQQAPLIALPVAKIPTAIEAAAPLARLAGSGLIRGLETAGINTYGRYADTGNIKEAAKGIPGDIAAGALLNTIASPRLVGQAGKQIVNDLQQAAVRDAQGRIVGLPGSVPLPGTSKANPYVQEQVAAQQAAKKVDQPGLIQRGKSAIADIKRKLVDSAAPIEDTLFNAQKQGKFEVLPSKNVSPQIDRALRSRQLAGQFAKDNGLVDVIKKVPNVDELNQYLIAKHAPDVEAAGFKTGRDLAADAKLVQDLSPTYEPYAQQIQQYAQKLLDYATETGLVSKDTAAALRAKYPNYVPLNRIFNELEQSGVPQGVGTKGIASLSKQNVVQKLQGSERAIQNPIESLLSKTNDAFNQGERNVAGQMLASYKDLPGNPFQITPLASGDSAAHTFSFIEGGVKKTFATTPEIAAAAKFLDKQQMGFIGKVLSLPVRLARVGITGINVPFIAGNLAKDQATAFINSNKALQTSVANPSVFLKSLWNAVGHGAEYDNWIRNAGGGTSFDLSRSAVENTVGKIRASRNVASNVLHTVTHPSQMLHAIEDVVSRGEELTRLQQFIGTRDSLLKQGRTLQDANILAAKQSREATTNFARSGDWGQALNSTFLYLNAGIQGSRNLVRNLAQRPFQTAAKIGLTVFTPLATMTAWNLSDPERKAAYDDIKDYEKESNLIIVPPNPVKDPATGKWNVIKIPFSQEVANLTVPVRKGIESLYGSDGTGFSDVAKALLGSSTGLNVQSPRQLLGQFTPQAVKPSLGAALNKNLFTGNDIVPQYLDGMPSKDLPPEMQVRDNTSGTARLIAKPFNTSPLKVEQFVRDTAGGVGSQLLNASDTALNKAGVIPSEQIGGQSILQGLQSRFSQAAGGQQLSNLYENKPTFKATKSATSSPNIVESNGTYYARIGKSVKGFDSEAAATLAIAKHEFQNSNKNIETFGDTVFRRDKDGSVTTTPRLDYEYRVRTNQLQAAKTQKNVTRWLQLANEQLTNLRQQYKDPTLDELEKIEIQEKATTLLTSMKKYQRYGGFTKPKKVAVPSLARPNVPNFATSAIPRAASSIRKPRLVAAVRTPQARITGSDLAKGR